MSAILVGHFTPGSPEWHAARAGGLGGSEIAAVLGLSRFESPYSLWHRKAGTIPPQPVNPEMEWGTRLEPVVIQKWCEEHPEWVPNVSGTYRSSERPWQIANPDLLAATPCACPDDLIHEETCAPVSPDMTLVEAKTALYGDEWGPSGTDQIPPYYLCQVRWYLDVFGFDTAHVAVLIGGHDYREYVIPQDDDDVRLMRDAGQEFIDSLRAGTAPDLDAHTATYVAVRQLHPDIAPETVDLPPDLAHEFCESRAELDAAKGRAQEATSRVADAMGAARKATFNGQTIATRQAKGEGTPYVVAARKLPQFTDRSVA